MKAPPTIIEHLKDQAHHVNFSLYLRGFFFGLWFFCWGNKLFWNKGCYFFACTVRAASLVVPGTLTAQKWFISSENAVLFHPSFLLFSRQRFCYAEAKENFSVSLNYLFFKMKIYPREVKWMLHNVLISILTGFKKKFEIILIQG